MKKIPTLFKRVFTEDHKKTILPEVTPGMEWVLQGEGVATIKWDGACCAIINGEIYKRYDAKQKYGKTPPEGAIPCQPEPDPITGHWPHWVKCESRKPEDKYFLEAFRRYKSYRVILECKYGYIPFEREFCGNQKAVTFEAVGPHWQSNPYGLKYDELVRHGDMRLYSELIEDQNGDVTFESIRNLLGFQKLNVPTKTIEGIVFWKDGEPQCKIKRSDFGFDWPPRKRENK